MCTKHTSKCGRYRVLVVNQHDIRRGEYIGRQWGRDAASVLANPRSLRAGWERGATLVHYRRELRAALDETVTEAWWNARRLEDGERAAMRAEMKRLFGLLCEEGEVVLRCFCAPQACHGDEIAAVLLEDLARWQLRDPTPARMPAALAA
jgi:Domain of unknown function (DUF4326)